MPERRPHPGVQTCGRPAPTNNCFLIRSRRWRYGTLDDMVFADPALLLVLLVPVLFGVQLFLCPFPFPVSGVRFPRRTPVWPG